MGVLSAAPPAVAFLSAADAANIAEEQTVACGDDCAEADVAGKMEEKEEKEDGDEEDDSDERWEAHLAALRAFKEEHGGRYPVQTSACAEERGLAAWRAAWEEERGLQPGALLVETPKTLQLAQGTAPMQGFHAGGRAPPHGDGLWTL